MLREEGIQFQACKIPDVKLWSWNVRIAQFLRVCTNILLIIITSDILTFSQHLSGPTITRFTRRPLYGRRWRLRDNDAFLWLRSSLAPCNTCVSVTRKLNLPRAETEFLHRNISDYESSIEVSTTRLQGAGFTQEIDRGTILPGGTESGSHFETNRSQDR